MLTVYFLRFYKMFPEEYLHRTLHKAVQPAIVWNSKVREYLWCDYWQYHLILYKIINSNMFHLKFSSFFFFTVNIPTEHVSSQRSRGPYFIWLIYEVSLLKYENKVWLVHGRSACINKPCSLSWFLALAIYHCIFKYSNCYTCC